MIPFKIKVDFKSHIIDQFHEFELQVPK